MLSQKDLAKLDAINAKLVYETEDWVIIVQSPMWESWEGKEKLFSLRTRTYNNYSDYINSMMGNMSMKVKLEYIPDDDYKDLQFKWELI